MTAAICALPNTASHLLNSRFVVTTGDCLLWVSETTRNSGFAPSSSSRRNPGSTIAVKCALAIRRIPHRPLGEHGLVGE